MGLSKKCYGTRYQSEHHCSCVSNPPPVIVRPNVTVQLPNPDPKRFRILSCYTHGEFIVLTVSYPDAINYEGKKILVFRASSPESLLQRTKGELDPHFCKDGTGPIARFEPTEEGAALAKLLVEGATKRVD